jgi:hypothetical protein
VRGGRRRPGSVLPGLAGANPFTGEPLVVERWDPGSSGKVARRPSLFKRHGRKIVPPLGPPEGDDAEWPEEAAPELLRTFPHIASKNLTGIELSALAKALVGREVPDARYVDCRDGEGRSRRWRPRPSRSWPH